MGSGVMDNGMIEKSKKIRWKTDEYMKTVENKEFKVESENRGSFYMEYDQTSLLVRSNCPIKIQAKNGMLKEPFYLTGGERVFKMK